MGPAASGETPVAAQSISEARSGGVSEPCPGVDRSGRLCSSPPGAAATGYYPRDQSRGQPGWCAEASDVTRAVERAGTEGGFLQPSATCPGSRHVTSAPAAGAQRRRPREHIVARHCLRSNMPIRRALPSASIRSLVHSHVHLPDGSATPFRVNRYGLPRIGSTLGRAAAADAGHGPTAIGGSFASMNHRAAR